jgi:hypothetical protein
MKQNEKIITQVLLMIVFIVLLAGTTSCRTRGYGCHGRESWNKMVRRIN